jgi:predicted ATPase/DNA-binding NarL/FixJ family response regulator
MTPQDAGEAEDTPGPSAPRGDDRRLRVVDREQSEAASSASNLPESRLPEGSSANLPLELTSFVGRQREIDEVKRLVADHRLLTLTGVGGSGKTHLALAVAFEVVEGFADGAWWVSLAPLLEPTLVPQAVARALGVSEQPGVPLADTLADSLRSRKLLLILDNCEHLIGACAGLADSLLRSCPGLKILATSREALGVAGEVSWPVPPLSLPESDSPPTAEELGRYEAVGLFVERARAAMPSFHLTEENAPALARLCRRLEGIPLAIELAAARTRVLSVGQILERLESSLKVLVGTERAAPARQRTLRGALDWSYDLLDEQESELFGCLSVFAGGWTLEAAEAVGAGDGIDEGEVLDLLSGLVDKSLVVTEAGPEGALRYRMLEPVRQYARERLEGSGEADAARRRHAAFFLALAEEAELKMAGPEQGAWLARLEREHDNLRAALSWTLSSGGAEPGGSARVGLGLAAALGRGRFWVAYSPSEGLGWLEKGLLRSGDTAPAPLRAKALNEAGWISLWRGDYERAVTLLEEGLALLKELGDKPGVAASLFHLGQTVIHQGDQARAEALREEAEGLRPELEDRRAKAFLLIFLAMAAQDENDYDRTGTLLKESLALSRGLGDLRGIAMSLSILGLNALDKDDDHERAKAFLEEMLRVLRELRDKVGTIYGLLMTAGVASLRAEPARAARLWGATEALQETTGVVAMTAFVRAHYAYDRYLAAARSRMDDAAWERAWAEGRAMTPDGAIDYALSEAQEGGPAVTPKERAGLSERELEVLRLVAQGLTDPQVASRLYISPRTVNRHLGSIYRKLGVPSRAAAAKAAVERDLL